GAELRCLSRVRVHAPRALRDVRDGDAHEVLGLRGDRAVRHRLRIEVQKRLVCFGREIAHLLELLSDVDAMKHHWFALFLCGCGSTPILPTDGGVIEEEATEAAPVEDLSVWPNSVS